MIILNMHSVNSHRKDFPLWLVIKVFYPAAKSIMVKMLLLFCLSYQLFSSELVFLLFIYVLKYFRFFIKFYQFSTSQFHFYITLDIIFFSVILPLRAFLKAIFDCWWYSGEDASLLFRGLGFYPRCHRLIFVVVYPCT